MKPVIKYATFEELKSSERTSLDNALSLKKHDDFKKLVKEIRFVKTHKDNKSHSRN